MSPLPDIARRPQAPVIVTGASRGIGRALVSQLLDQGHSVIGVARARPDRPDSATFRFIACDLSDAAATARLVDALRQLGPLGLINNAGLQTEADLSALAPGAAAALVAPEIGVNLVAPCLLSYGLLPVLAQAPGGFVCNVNSALGMAPKMAAPAYCAAKAGLGNLSVALRGQARNWPGLLIAEAILPLVETDMTRGRGSGKISAEQAAAAILRGLEHRKTRIWIGKTRIVRLLGRVAPGLTSRLLLGQLPPPPPGDSR
ncbi:SDR family NAD(P)-dependent oxidoreductase [Pararhodobacter marinus]|nr:SDR family NAD(P)-dependent oxidoreductase [Pararhodobacter marinus]